MSPINYIMKSFLAFPGERGPHFLIKATGLGVRWACHTVRDLWARVLGHASTIPLITPPRQILNIQLSCRIVEHVVNRSNVEED
jgi:hypothetical protein